MFKPIKPFIFFTQPILPTAYTKSLSYMELLEQMGARLEETIKAYNELIEYYNSLDGLLEEMQNTLSSLDGKITDMENKINSEIDNLNSQFESLKESNKNDIDTALLNLTTSINNLQKELENLINTSLLEMDKKIQAAIDTIEDNNETLLKQVDEKLNAFLNNLPDVQNVLVTDPTTGKVVTVSEALENLLTYFNNEIKSKLEIYSPVTGSIVPTQNVIQFTYGLIMESGSYTCEEWDKQNSCTCGQYDTIQASSFQQDWISNKLYSQYDIEEEND